MSSIRAFRWLVVGMCSMHAFAAEETASAPPPPGPPKSCTAPEFRQFDFWLGDWNVTDPKGNVAGKNLVTLELDGCVLHEHWTGSKGGVGESFNLYDAASKRWHQTWVSNRGALLLLDGGLVGGRMVLTGTARGPKGETVINRIAWEKLADGRVRQTWDVSSDSGTSWTTSFDGYYSKH